jgi:carboxyl-terminal processing protease
MGSKAKYLPILLFSCVAMGIVIGGMVNFPKRTLSKQNARKVKIEQLIDFINEEYVDDVNSDSIVDMTVNTILANLDPHSVYLLPSEQSSEAEIMKGDFVGIGVNFYMYNDTITVVKPLENGPAAKAGILSGDRILYADNSKLFGRKLPTDSLYSKLKGEKGSKVLLTIFRKSTNKKLKIAVEREVVPIKSVDTYLMLNKTSGYIKINRFAENTYDEFRVGLEQLKKQGMTTLVIDLRDNGGGYLEKAVEVIDELLKDKELIVFTKNRKGIIDKTFATEGGIFEKGKVVVLIDENSASASEIVAGALQDNDRATIYGRRSYGKGLVQEDIVLKDGSDIRLTIARYYTPTGRCIQKAYNGNYEDYLNEEIKRIENGEQFHPDTTLFVDSLKFKTPKGKVVYGGGGIFPDIFIPADTLGSSWYFADLRYSSSFQQFAFDFVQNKRSFWKSLNHFESTFNVDESLLNQFVSYAQKNFKIQSSKVGLTQSKRLIALSLKAEIARQIWTEDGFYRIINREDKEVKEALKLFLK